MPELGENTQVKANLAFMAKVIAGVGTAVWGYSVIWNKISTVEHQIEKVTGETEYLRDYAPRLQAIEKFAEQHKKDVEHLMGMQDAPITSDYQQFERLKYLEKEVDILRQKVEGSTWK